MEKDINELKDLYTEGKLGGKELDDFLKMMDDDPELARDVKLQLLISRTLKDEGSFALRENLNAIHEKQKKKKFGKIVPMRYYRVAAGFAAIIAVGALLLFVMRPPLNKRLYSQYYKAYEASYSVRSADASGDKFNQAMGKYSEGNYKDAWSMLKELSKVDKTDMGSFFFRGIAAMEIDDLDDAMISFNAIIADKRSLYVEQSEWYYALCLLKKDNIVAARSALQKISMDNGFYKTSAEEILNKLGN